MRRPGLLRWPYWILDRALLVSDALWLEVMPKAIYEKRQDEVAFYQTIFERAEHCPWQLDVL